jgi:hypothetical protein
MSMGYYANCRLYKEDIDVIIYQYSGENWNREFNKGDAVLYDGFIIIKKDFDYTMSVSDLFLHGYIKVKPCKNEFQKGYIPYYFAFALVNKLFKGLEDFGYYLESCTYRC